MLFSDVRQVVGKFARDSVRIDDKGVSLGGVNRVVNGIGCSLTTRSVYRNHHHPRFYCHGRLLIVSFTFVCFAQATHVNLYPVSRHISRAAWCVASLDAIRSSSRIG